MHCTTGDVVLMPIERESRLTVMPMRQPMIAMNAANATDFTRPTMTCSIASAECTRSRNEVGVMSSNGFATVIAPAKLATSPTNTSSGSATMRASSRGITRTCIGESPRVRIASISSVSTMVPSWAVKAAPDLPATITATMIGESSRVVPIATPSTTKILAPYFSACKPKRYASTMPIRKVTRMTTGIASMQTCWNWDAASFSLNSRGRRATSLSANAARPKKSRCPCIRPRNSITCSPISASTPCRRRGVSPPVSPSRPMTASTTRA